MSKLSQLSWPDQLVLGDDVWRDIDAALFDTGTALPQIPRVPDVRVIVQNNSGELLTFLNPGNHSGGAREQIPCEGNQKAAMIMPAGRTLERQYRNALDIVALYDLKEKGLTPDFCKALNTDNRLRRLVKEAYGPAPYDGQVGKLKDLVWANAAGRPIAVKVINEGLCAVGARPPVNEDVVKIVVPFSLRGSDSVAEVAAGLQICLARDFDASGRMVSRPIDSKVARGFYGQAMSRMLEVVVSSGQGVKQINFPNVPGGERQPSIVIGRIADLKMAC